MEGGGDAHGGEGLLRGGHLLRGEHGANGEGEHLRAADEPPEAREAPPLSSRSTTAPETKAAARASRSSGARFGWRPRNVNTVGSSVAGLWKRRPTLEVRAMAASARCSGLMVLRLAALGGTPPPAGGSRVRRRWSTKHGRAQRQNATPGGPERRVQWSPTHTSRGSTATRNSHRAEEVNHRRSTRSHHGSPTGLTARGGRGSCPRGRRSGPWPHTPPGWRAPPLLRRRPRRPRGART